MTAPLLRMTDVHVRLSGSHILQGVDLTVRRGGVTALLGRNGVVNNALVSAGLVRAPIECFEAALAAYRERYGGD